MLLSALILTTSAALAAAQPLDPKVVCKTAGACLRIKEFHAIEPVDPKSTYHTAIQFTIVNDNPELGASAECETDWPHGTQGWPRQSKECSLPGFSFYFNGFDDIDQDFTIEAKHGYRDESISKRPPPPGTAPMDHVTNFARAKVTKDTVVCETFGVSYKFCRLKEDAEILLPIYARTG
ncbi:hypothetical protein IWZ03DRAFT_376293 [Phyllosticta citriasiana]|uniref:AA1-like domain-containing protein n=1 Tax=Phyllosticta citriasiana TaxID=595635 RepID=A0ABR1KLV6_9PEZI